MADRLLAANHLEQLPSATHAHVDALIKSTQMLADLSQADVLVLLRSADQSYITVGHRRPVNARTLYLDDQVGVRLTAAERPFLHRAFLSGEIEDGGLLQPAHDRWIRTLAVPVRHDDRVVAVLAREFSPDIDSVPGTLQFVAFESLRRMADMIAAGAYPYALETRGHEHPPRVVDGFIRLDNRGAIEFASSNAVTHLNLLGVDRDPRGHRLRELGVVQNAVRSAYTQHLPFIEEVTNRGNTMVLACYPLIRDDGVMGSLVLMRDITDLRDRDKLLLSKDATIAEIHHRVKNNLQTISSLLHLQTRRLSSQEAVNALSESVRRIQSIAVVHEILSHRSGDEVPFGDIIRSLVRNVRDGLLDRDSPVEIEVRATEEILPSDISTTLAVVLSELLQNTIDHAFNDGQTGHRVLVDFVSTDVDLSLSVSDSGAGFPEDFDLATADGLGLTIVRTLVTSELNGTLSIDTPSTSTPTEGALKTTIRLTVPLVPWGER